MTRRHYKYHTSPAPGTNLVLFHTAVQVYDNIPAELARRNARLIILVLLTLHNNTQ